MVDDDEVFIDIADGTVTTTLRSSTPIPEPAPEPRQVVAETTTSGPVLE
ncbi:MAG TPA: hypothetical protein HA311_08970, partial [Candidatus Poseidoniaceae archaeon]|nr:hypothetical protein [Candidatus Poseidoniaceae archaeon]